VPRGPPCLAPPTAAPPAAPAGVLCAQCCAGMHPCTAHANECTEHEHASCRLLLHQCKPTCMQTCEHLCNWSLCVVLLLLLLLLLLLQDATPSLGTVSNKYKEKAHMKCLSSKRCVPKPNWYHPKLDLVFTSVADGLFSVRYLDVMYKLNQKLCIWNFEL